MGRRNKSYSKDLHQQAYDRLTGMQAVVEQTPGSEISIEYNAIADMMIADKCEREGTDYE